VNRRLGHALSKRYQMVTSPSSGTLRLRIALTDATTPNATENTVATYPHYVSIADSLASLAFNNGVGYFAEPPRLKATRRMRRPVPCCGKLLTSVAAHGFGRKYVQYLA
jgi:hypothetical protein